MSTLLVDNYDSYTYNVFHLLASVSGEEPIVIHNDMVSWRALSRWDFDAIVLSPGPGHPGRWHDFGVCADILRSSEIPVLGICLGHQGLGRALSGLVGSAPCAMHGRLSQVHHLGSGLFEGLPQDFSVVRYHSLAVIGPDRTRGSCHRMDRRRRGDGDRAPPPAAVGGAVSPRVGRHRVWAGGGRELLFARPRPPPRARLSHDSLAHGAPRSHAARAPGTCGGRRGAAAERAHLHGRRAHRAAVRTALRRLRPCLLAGLRRRALAPGAVLLSRHLRRSRALRAQYDVHEGHVTRHDAAGVSVEEASIFDVLDRELSARALPSPEGAARGLLCGFVGYLGYECKADCGSPNIHRSDVPDAVQMLATRVVAVDHAQGLTHLLALGREGEDEVQWWLDEAEAAVRETLAASSRAGDGRRGARAVSGGGKRPAGAGAAAVGRAHPGRLPPGRVGCRRRRGASTQPGVR